MGATRPTGVCALCRRIGLLCRSHLLPAASYKPLRSDSSTNPNPLVITPTRAYTTSRQVQDHLLCEPCEQLFRSNGEDWVLAHAFVGTGFKLRDLLSQSVPLYAEGDRRLYACAQSPTINLEKMVYFAASVFWRAGAHQWRRDERTIKFDFGRYAEPLRLYLLGKASFPSGMALHTCVSSLADSLLGTMHLPEECRIQGIRTYQFAIPGIYFRLMVSGHMAENWFKWSTAPGRHGLIGVMPDLDLAEVVAMARRHRAVRRVT